jgi:hypothetical protein
MEKAFHIGLAYQDPIIQPDVVARFEEDIRAPRLLVRVEPVPMMGARAALEWLMPTAIVAYIARPYFESFLGEMGKDHYAMTKKAFVNLRARISEKFGDRLRIFASKGKLDPDVHRFSPVFSIEAQTPFDYRIKFLIQTDMESGEFSAALDAFLRLMGQIYGNEELSEPSKALLTNPPVGRVMLVCYDAESGELTYVDPIPGRKSP